MRGESQGGRVADPFTNFLRNAWEPIAIPRWAITLKYLLFTAAGLSAFVSLVRTLSDATPEGYIPIWAAFVTGGALLGAFGSFRPKWGWIEALGAWVLVSFLIVLTALVFARGAVTVGILLLIVTVLPGVRAAFLLIRIALSFSRRQEWRL